MKPVQGRIPVGFPPVVVPVLTHLGHRAPAGGLEQLMLEDALKAQLAAVHVGVRHAPGSHGPALGVQAHFDGAAGGAVATSGVFPLNDTFIGNFYRVLLASSE